MTGHGAAAGTLGRIVRHEARAMRSLALWAARRTHGVGVDGQAFGYARGQAAMVYGITFACLVETVGISYLLRDLPVAHAVMLVLDVYTLLTILALQSAAVTHPHVLTGRSLRIRRGVTVDLLVPLADLTAVRRELRTSPDRRPGELTLDIGALTNVTVELAAPVTRTTLLGRTERITTVRLYAEDPDALARELRSRQAAGRKDGDTVAR
ncbi:hypothetical protein [Streptomyces uncialis]|uniref:hypothetical protein n=1 Tax=Streptomyces uncialis TaxID=1048205 RepID=UPI0022511E64|nr:hypothetical protein [Streptomyces uncialis]MCX4663552.1 hypothetical protein [Streptomyces uncialis]